MQAKSSEDRRGVEEHRHVRRRGQLQAFGNEQKLHPEQRTGQQPAAPGVRHLVPAAAKTDQQADQYRRHARTQGLLHHWRNIWRGQLDHYLLNAPDQTQHQHYLQGKGIGIATGGAHCGHPLSANGMAKSRQLWIQRRLSAAAGVDCQPCVALRLNFAHRLRLNRKTKPRELCP
ncbi:hypothetical protein D3C72_1489260 [compost metagenome]